MNTRHSRRSSRNTTERMLTGPAQSGADPLSRVLAAAAAPAHEGELTGERMAVAAFEARHLVPVGTPQKERKSMLGKFLTLKVLASSIAALATGGVALAASNAAFTTSTHGNAVTVGGANHSSTSVTVRSGDHAHHRSHSVVSHGITTHTHTTISPPTSPSAITHDAAALCRMLVGQVAPVGGAVSDAASLRALSGVGVLSVVQKTEFSTLVLTARSVAAVPDYCALVLRLPGLPQPGEVTALPTALLGQLLSGLPTSQLSSVLSSLPKPVLGHLLTQLHASVLSGLLHRLPTSLLSRLLHGLPASVLAQLPQSVLSLLSGLGLGLGL